jgi:hypothetical protein
MARVTVGEGDTSMYWKDVWNIGSLQHPYPHLFSFAREPNYYVSRFLCLLPDYSRNFQQPLINLPSSWILLRSGTGNQIAVTVRLISGDQ